LDAISSSCVRVDREVISLANDFWLYRWLDEFELNSSTDVEKLLQPSAKAVKRLHEIAASQPWQPPEPYSRAGPAIVAGRGIDLSGDLDCCHRVCQTRQVDALFGRALHYFDEIVVAGPPAHRYARDLEDPDTVTLSRIAEHAAALLYLRELGVDSMVSFVQKLPACEEHFRVHTEEAGLSGLIDQASDWVDRLAKNGTVEDLHEHDDHWHYTFSHHDLEHTVWGVVPGPEDGTSPTRRSIAEGVFVQYAAHLVSDVLSARYMELPLGTSVRMHGDVLSRTGPPKTVTDVAFDLRLPVLEELPIRDIVRIRQDEWEYFESFRHALTRAIAERLSSDPTSPSIAEEVKRDVIDPAVLDIAARLRSVERVMDKKIYAAIGVGDLVTTVGVLTAAPLIVGAGVVAFGSSLQAVQKYFEDKGAIELSDMYFLWQLEMAASRHGG
jgi:hypothetical protein